jgi:tRNA pseudouridine55 synthase
MDGILIIDKPAGITSHDVVARVRRILKTRRVGHTGTLDPFATGVMVILIGRATRLAQFLDKDEKEYEAVVRFGFETDTGDRTGMQNAERRMQNAEVTDLLEQTDWSTVFGYFRGSIEQTPPMYSAKKIDGKKLYEYARKGKIIERNAVKIEISKLELVEEFRGPRSEICIRVVCSAGTYIRTLAEDIGRELGVGAHLAALRRTRAGIFSISQSLTLDELEASAEPAAFLLAIENAVLQLPQFELSAERVEKTMNGLSTRIAEALFHDGEAVRMHDESGRLVAIGFYNETENSIQPKVVLV